MYQKIVKRIGDLLASLLLFVLLSPIFILTTLILLFVNKGNPFFFQQRPGKNEEIFSVIKFKSMNDKKDKNGVLLPNHDRITPFGNFIRKTSIDEIPQLLSVIKGEMSLVGPRPLLIRYLPYYSQNEKLRHSVKPGITGLAQISGRNTLDWDKRLALDVEYVKTISFKNDMLILFKTVEKVFKSEDVVLDQKHIMPDLDELRKEQTKISNHKNDKHL